MKKRTNIIVLITFFVTAVISFLLILNWIEVIEIPIIPKAIVGWDAMIFPVVPWFCIQLLFCSITDKAWIKAIPTAFIGIIIFFILAAFVVSSGWDSFGYLIVLILCIAPLAGCLIAFFVNWICSYKHKKEM